MKFTGVNNETFKAIVLEAHRIATEKAGTVIKPETAALFESMEIELSSKMRSTAGRARVNWGSWGCESRKATGAKIWLNFRLLSENPKEIFFTYAHELAHIVADANNLTRCKHDDRWKTVARALGDDAGRCHTMDTSHLKAKRRKHVWTCQGRCGRDYAVGPVRHKRWLQHQYWNSGKSPATCGCGGEVRHTGAKV